MKTPVKRSQAAPIIHVHDVVHMLMNQCQTKIGSKVTAKKAITTNVLSNYNKGLIVQKN
jgi:hypothetical protein